MNEPLVFRKNIFIPTTKDQVWEALTKAEYTKHYMFGCIPECSWEVGSEIKWRGEEDGVVYVKGKVIKFEPNDILALSSFDPNTTDDIDPEKHLVATYTLSETEEGTTLQIEQGDFSVAARGQDRFKESEKAWDYAMGEFVKLFV